MKGFLLAVLLFGAITSAKAQDSIVQYLGVQFLYHPYDFFAGFRYERENGNFQHQFLLSAGVNRTFFQQRLYPQLAYQLGYHLVNKRWLQAGPFIRGTFSMSHVNKQDDHGMVYNEELQLGGSVGTGQRNRFCLNIGIGPVVEQSWAVSRSRFVNWYSWTYFGEISYVHAL